MSTATNVHPTAIVSDRATIDPTAEVGPYTVIEGDVTLGPGVRIIAQAFLRGPLTIGKGTVVWPGAVLGGTPQDYKFSEDTPTAGIVIGEDCIIREHVTVHSATNDETPTTIKNRVFMMATSHAGHDCLVEDDVILINGAKLAGHVHAMERACVSGNSVIHQFCRLGRFAFVSGVPNSKMPAFSRKNGRFSGKNRSKRVRLICSSSTSTWAKSVLNVASSVRLGVMPYLRSRPASRLISVRSLGKR